MFPVKYGKPSSCKPLFGRFWPSDNSELSAKLPFGILKRSVAKLTDVFLFSDNCEMADREDRLFSARLAEQADRFEGEYFLDARSIETTVA